MGILSRASYVIRSKLNAIVSSQEDPSETLDYSYEKMRDELQDVKQGIADLTTQKKRLEIQKRRLAENVEKHNEQAREAVNAGRDDLARRALEKKKQKMTQIEDLEGQIADLQNTQDRLVEKKDELQERIERFRTEKETMKARYEAAEASARVSEAMSGVGDEMEETARAIERARDRTDEMEARAEAMDELQETGAFDDALSDEDELDRELREMRSDSEVEAELETLKAESGRGSTEVESAPEEPPAGEDADETTDAADPELEAELADLKEEDEETEDESN
ncbi:PspA/IM30 family protein [Haloglomus salinum]|uniref:PspA/IM30 family protein n=1 Tax=Haloglomus salinum TaxID=2962673 RepID=UPI0020C9A858|nr:PspA/IM30 family protein [Haloglomus salinum]